MAQDVSHFYFYDASSLTDSDLALDFNKWASQDLAKAASASLGECEFEPYLDGSMLIDDEIFAEAAAQGQTMFASAGDTGASCAVEGTNGVPDSGPPFVNYPASSPYVVAVGGTMLVTKSTGSYDFETSWDAGGGGLSQFEYRPYWQAEGMPVTDGTTGDRGVPDLAMDADPTTGARVYTGSTTTLYSSTGWEGVGGTSLSAPLALGTWARIESSYGNRLGFAAPDLYGVYLDGSCNTSTTTLKQICTTPALHAPLAGDNGLYPATPGYNYNTGLGSFDTVAMVSAVKPFVPAAQRKPAPGPPPPPRGH
jgi:subtilase family serine protease